MSESLLITIFCIMIVQTVWLAHVLQKSADDKTYQSFSLVCVATLSYLVLTLAGDKTESIPSLISVCYILNLLAFLSIDFAILAFCRYLYTLFGNIKKKDTLFLRLAAYTTFLRIAVVLVLFVTGNLFVIKDGEYIDMPAMNAVYCLTVVAIVFSLIAILRNRKRFTAKEMFGVLAYLILPVLLIIIEAATEIYELTGIALSFSTMLIYILIQATAIEQSKLRENVLEEISSTDLLTGLNNRRAYYTYLADMPQNKNIGVLFCDINGLKQTNDTKGHSAGDDLINFFADILKESFREDAVFRISGDEFVVFLPNINESKFLQRVAVFRTVIANNNSVAAVGHAYGKTNDAEKLISTAEGLMYEDKRAYHLATGTSGR